MNKFKLISGEIIPDPLLQIKENCGKNKLTWNMLQNKFEELRRLPTLRSSTHFPIKLWLCTEIIILHSGEKIITVEEKTAEGVENYVYTYRRLPASNDVILFMSNDGKLMTATCTQRSIINCRPICRILDVEFKEHHIRIDKLDIEKRYRL